MTAGSTLLRNQSFKQAYGGALLLLALAALLLSVSLWQLWEIRLLMD